MELFFADPARRRDVRGLQAGLETRKKRKGSVALHRDLIRLRKTTRFFRRKRPTKIHGTVLAAEAFALRYVGLHGEDRLVVVNLGRDLFWTTAAYPLLAPPHGSQWKLLFSTGNPKYGGAGSGRQSTAANGTCPATRHWCCDRSRRCSEPHEALTGWPDGGDRRVAQRGLTLTICGLVSADITMTY